MKFSLIMTMMEERQATSVATTGIQQSIIRFSYPSCHITLRFLFLFIFILFCKTVISFTMLALIFIYSERWYGGFLKRSEGCINISFEPLSRHRTCLCNVFLLDPMFDICYYSITFIYINYYGMTL